jgi:hypothetical protein
VSRAIRKHDRKNVVGCWKGPQKVFLGWWKVPKNTSRIIGVLSRLSKDI